MPGFASQIKDGSIHSLDAAAAWRLDEAQVLQSRGKRIAALYWYGYVAEIRLTAACLRLKGYGLSRLVTLQEIDNLRAEARKVPCMTRDAHDVQGWGRFVVLLRKTQLNAAGTAKAWRWYGKNLAMDIASNAGAVYDHWRPRLRYKAMIPTLSQLGEVERAAKWINANYPKTWS